MSLNKETINNIIPPIISRFSKCVFPFRYCALDFSGIYIFFIACHMSDPFFSFVTRQPLLFSLEVTLRHNTLGRNPPAE